MPHTTWYQLIQKSFNLDELEDLSFRLNIDFENLSGRTKNGKVRSLLLYCQRNQQGDELLGACQELRPNVSWPQPFQGTPLGVSAPVWQRRWFIGAVVILVLLVALVRSIQKEYHVRVVDSLLGSPIERAEVIVEVNNVIATDLTDVRGKAVLPLDLSAFGSSGDLTVNAVGYSTRIETITIQKSSLPHEVKLDAVCVSPLNISVPADIAAQNVSATLEIAGQVLNLPVDQLGRISFCLDEYADESARLELKAPGYLDYTLDIQQLASSSFPSTIELLPEPTPDQTPTPDPRPTIAALIEKEATAVLTKDFELIEEIFAPKASKTDASKSPPQVWKARDRYRETFESEDHHEVNHTNLKIEINGDMATVTNDSCGRFTDKATNQEFSYSSPQSDKWAFEHDDNGQWWVTDLTYGIQSTNPDHFYEFEDETDGCWRVRSDNNEPQGDQPHLSELAYEGDGSLKFPFNLSKISTRRAQVMHENMPFAGEFSAYVYIPPDAPNDLIASFFAMELDQDPFKYHGIDTEEGQIHQLIPDQWTEVRWKGDVSQWESIVHLLGIEIRREGGGVYDGYVLIDNINIKSK